MTAHVPLRLLRAAVLENARASFPWFVRHVLGWDVDRVPEHVRQRAQQLWQDVDAWADAQHEVLQWISGRQ